MSTTINTEEELDAIKAALVLLSDLEIQLEEELKRVEAERPNSYNHDRPFQLRETLRRLWQGAPLGQGMDARLWAVLTTGEMRRFQFHSPGIAPLLRLRAKLITEREAANNPPPPPVKHPFRYIGPPWKVKIAGQRADHGGVLQLTEEEASKYLPQGVIERVLESVGPAAGGAGRPNISPADPATGSSSKRKDKTVAQTSIEGYDPTAG